MVRGEVSSRPSRGASIALLVLVGLVMAGNGMVIPIIPYLVGDDPGTATLAGLLVSAFGLARLGVNYPTGKLYGRVTPRTLMLIGALLLMVGSAGAACMTGDLTVLVVFRFVQGAGSGVVLTVASVVVFLQTEPTRRARSISSFQAALFVGGGLGPLAGGMIAGAWGVNAPFWGYCLVGVALIVLSLRIATPERAATGKTSTSHRTGSLWGTPFFGANLFASFTVGVIRTGGLWLLLPAIAANTFGMGPALVGFSVAATSFLNMFLLAPAGRVIDRLGWRSTPWLAALIQAITLVLLAIFPTQPLYWVTLVVMGLANAFIGPALASSLVEMSGDSRVATAVGIQRTAGDAGFVLGPLLVGLSSDMLGASNAEGLVFVAGVAAVSACWWGVSIMRSPGAERNGKA